MLTSKLVASACDDNLANYCNGFLDDDSLHDVSESALIVACVFVAVVNQAGSQRPGIDFRVEIAILLVSSAAHYDHNDFSDRRKT